ncbi:SubName: Full=Related to TIM11-subunit E of the dimeric form of mitochondrial F1F0-ATPase {ECO:0000313/EMBL:CCA67156.1} [Serendipita indica DSM 11827]|uniref:ATP synthase F(0) complex subunit e, mitochondrial n=1 Tax=Serendipita indica (strain DSM 11827) TaxID=1109443 RepID=G4T765_SERID|nr:SubName: Full=Related to TIM11-subunit E of the dimeric form of mitochondrial F1F0-ATPase {ECO:0000313/EMBL:CCA67156.1} [Serendipita indica DSM 11827]CCA67156.1 related to TIM11-subunit E of the dimeric form of mitochondrial F1F0-ATPase [Serendipita indica DSM 11827]
MPSPTVNVIRYSALVGGIGYGIMHRRTLQANENKRKEHEAEHRREKLIEEARKAWREQQRPKKTDGVITNPEDPNFDLEKLLLSLESK